MAWVLGIITGLLLAILLVLTGNGWVCGWIFGAGVVWFVWTVAHSAIQDARTRRAIEPVAPKRTEKPLDLRSFMGMGK
jgi:hypothetical protein